MPEDAHRRAVSHLVASCSDSAVVCILAYGSYARGDYRPESDIDLLVVLDSRRYSPKDLRGLIEASESCRKQFGVTLQMDIVLDSEIELWNKGILLEGHSFVDLCFYNKDGKVLFGEDVRRRFVLPHDMREKASLVLLIIEAQFKRWILETSIQCPLVPHWMTGWLLVTFLNTQGKVDLTSFQETCEAIEKVTVLARTPEFEKYKRKEQLAAEEFLTLLNRIKHRNDKPQVVRPSQTRDFPIQ